MLKQAWANRPEQRPFCELIWTGEASPCARIGFVAYDSDGGPLLRRSYEFVQAARLRAA
jgi:hypothetical protein